MASGLKKFENREVASVKVAITNAGDGLSEAMSIEPQELRLGDTVFIVLEAEVAQVSFKPVDKDTPNILTRVQKLKAGTATLVNKEMVFDVLEDQKQAIEEARGVQRFDFEDDDAEVAGE